MVSACMVSMRFCSSQNLSLQSINNLPVLVIGCLFLDSMFSILPVCLSLCSAIMRGCLQERALGCTPSEMMDRDRAFIPAQHIGFMDSIAAPVFK